MDIKDQVCSLELSKRLKALGYPQESLWWWKLLCIKSNSIDILKDDWEFTYQPLLVTEEEAVKTQDLLNDVRNPNSIAKLYSAPTAAEIGMALPYPISFYNKIEGQGYRVGVDMGMLEYVLTGRSGGKYNPINFYADTEAEARGLMWEYLKKNGLLKDKNVEK